jgi:hypothetical protein
MGVDYSSPDFYNQPTFLKVEEGNPRLLAAYGEYVEARNYDKQYLQRSHRVLKNVIAFLHRELVKDGRLAACRDASFTTMKILERLGIWCHMVGGSLTIDFAPETGLATRYWAHIFGNPDAAGHAWITAPPFTVIDMTIGRQPSTEQIKPYVPEYVMTMEAGPVAGVSLEDLLDINLEREMRRGGYRIPTIHELMRQQPHIAAMMTTFRPFSVSYPKATLKYFPCRPEALKERFEEARTHCFSGRNVPQLFADMMAEIGDEVAPTGDVG